MNWFALFPKVELLAHGYESFDNVVGELMQWAKQSKKNEGGDTSQSPSLY